MAFSSTDLASVESAITALAAGERVTTVTIDGNTTEYAPTSLPALLRLRDRIKTEVADAQSTARYTRIVCSKGY
jgi:hypothetical protein